MGDPLTAQIIAAAIEVHRHMAPVSWSRSTRTPSAVRDWWMAFGKSLRDLCVLCG